jgi:translation initiation factor IF-3
LNALKRPVPNKGKRFQEQEKDAHRINRHITAPQVRVISDTGEQLGVLLTREAIRRAEETGLDLVEVAPEAKPPVCKLMDYGKFKYREQKKKTEARKKRSEVELKELRLRYSTDKGDLDTKLKHARDFLNEGDKVKFSLRFRGREIVYNDLGWEKLNEVKANLADIAVVDDISPPKGRQIHITFAPSKEKPKTAPAKPATATKVKPTNNPGGPSQSTLAATKTEAPKISLGSVLEESLKVEK